jgi:predicted HTH domain antitoxin
MTEFLVKEGLNFLIPKYFKNRAELLEESVKIILRSNQTIRKDLAIYLYLNDKMSISKAAEMGGITTVEFKEILAERGYRRIVESEPIEEIDKKIKEVFG